MGIARKEVCAEMGLKEGALDGEWKKDVRQAVMDAIVSGHTASHPRWLRIPRATGRDCVGG